MASENLDQYPKKVTITKPDGTTVVIRNPSEIKKIRIVVPPKKK